MKIPRHCPLSCETLDKTLFPQFLRKSLMDAHQKLSLFLNPYRMSFAQKPCLIIALNIL